MGILTVTMLRYYRLADNAFKSTKKLQHFKLIFSFGVENSVHLFTSENKWHKHNIINCTSAITLPF